MSYGVKYRLNFSDESGVAKKLEICKKNYSGSVIDMIGGAEPVVVKWTADDDEYSPIIGSECIITLKQTDSVTYEDFFDADEREYLVKVYYQYAGTGAAIWNLTQVDWQDADFNWENTSSIFQAYWSGFIVNDNYRQVVQTTPFEIKLKALDGLGLLDAYDMALPDTDASTDAQNIFYYVYKVLQNTGLSFPIYYSNDISFAGANYQITNNDGNNIGVKFINYITDRQETATINSGSSAEFDFVVVPTLAISGANNINNVTQTQDFFVPAYRALETVFPDVENMYKPGDLFNDAKTQLSNILKSINSRIFQSRNRWYIISNSSYSNQSLKDSIATSAASGTIPSNIRQSEQTALENNGTENVQFVTFSEAGIFSGIVLENVLYEIKTDLQNIGVDMVKEQRKPIKRLSLEMNQENEKRIIFSPNNSFEFTPSGNPSFGYTFASGSIGAFPIVKQGNQSYRSNSKENVDNTNTQLLITNTNIHQANTKTALPNILRFSYFMDIDDNFTVDNDDPNLPGPPLFGDFFFLTLSYQFYFTVNSNTYYYRQIDNTFVKNTEINNTFGSPEPDLNRWITIEKGLPTDLDDILDAADKNKNCTLFFRLNKPSTNVVTGYNFLYVDDIYFAFEPEQDANSIVFEREVADTFTGIREFKFDYTGHNTAAAYFRPRDNNPSTYKRLNEITSQQMLNDNRANVTRFEGTFRNIKSNGNPLGFESKIFVDYNTQPSNFAPVSGIIDQMEYAVKSNRYKLNFRLPNQDNDKANTLVIKEI